MLNFELFPLNLNLKLNLNLIIILNINICLHSRCGEG